MLLRSPKGLQILREACKSKILSTQLGVILQTKLVYLIVELSPLSEFRVTLLPSMRELRNQSSADSDLLRCVP
jgi:hypothetical protein